MTITIRSASRLAIIYVIVSWAIVASSQSVYDSYEPTSEWVITMTDDGGAGGESSSSSSSFDAIGEELEHVSIKRKDRIGNTLIYVVRGKDSALSAALAERSIDYDSFSKNYMISTGPGDVGIHYANEKKNSNVVRKDSKRTYRDDYYEEEDERRSQSSLPKRKPFFTALASGFPPKYHGGTIGRERGGGGGGGGPSSVVGDISSIDYECRTEPFVSNVGYESGHFSWGIDRIDQRGPILDRQACLFTTPYSEISYDDIVDVFVVDTGVQNDPSFVFPVSYDYSYYDADGSHSSDCNGHGTHVAGLVSSTIYGVSPWNVQIRSVKALDCKGKGDFASLAAALLWIKQNKSLNRRTVVNLSLGSSGGRSSSISALIRSLWLEDGVFVVAAAGNYGSGDCDVFPSNVEEVISVGSTDSRDARTSFSNYGRCVDVFAPGASLISCNSRNSKKGASMSGTSMSAPIVTGALANWLYAYGGTLSSSSPSSAKSAFFKSFTRGKINPMTISQETPNAMVYVGTDAIYLPGKEDEEEEHDARSSKYPSSSKKFPHRTGNDYDDSTHFNASHKGGASFVTCILIIANSFFVVDF